MNEQERAEEHLRTIRRLMERGTIYRAISAPTALVGGLLSIAASIVWMKRGAQTFHPTGFLILWLAVFLLTAGTNTVIIILGARKRKEVVFSASMKAALMALAPPFIIAALYTAASFPAQLDPPDELSICLFWAVFYSLGLLATSTFAPRSLIILGWAFFVTGIVTGIALQFGGDNSPLLLSYHASSIFMALTFGLFHLIYAACAWPRRRTEPEL